MDESVAAKTPEELSAERVSSLENLYRNMFNADTATITLADDIVAVALNWTEEINAAPVINAFKNEFKGVSVHMKSTDTGTTMIVELPRPFESPTKSESPAPLTNEAREEAEAAALEELEPETPAQTDSTDKKPAGA